MRFLYFQKGGIEAKTNQPWPVNCAGHRLSSSLVEEEKNPLKKEERI